MGVAAIVGVVSVEEVVAIGGVGDGGVNCDNDDGNDSGGGSDGGGVRDVGRLFGEQENCPGKGLAYLSLVSPNARGSFANGGTCKTPPPWLPGWWCRKCSGSPSIFASQSMTFISSSVHAGLEA